MSWKGLCPSIYNPCVDTAMYEAKQMELFVEPNLLEDAQYVAVIVVV